MSVDWSTWQHLLVGRSKLGPAGVATWPTRLPVRRMASAVPRAASGAAWTIRHRQRLTDAEEETGHVQDHGQAEPAVRDRQDGRRR